MLVRLDRLEEAETWLRRQADGGDYDAVELLATVLSRRGDNGQASQWRARAEAEATRRAELRGGSRLGAAGGAPDLGVIMATAVVATAVAPFVKTLVTKAAEDTYMGVRTLLCRLFRKHQSTRDDDYSFRNNHLLIVEDPDPRLNLALHLWTDTSDEALRALADLDIEALVEKGNGKKVKRVRVYWNQTTKSWQILDK